MTDISELHGYLLILCKITLPFEPNQNITETLPIFPSIFGILWNNHLQDIDVKLKLDLCEQEVISSCDPNCISKTALFW